MWKKIIIWCGICFSALIVGATIASPPNQSQSKPSPVPTIISTKLETLISTSAPVETKTPIPTTSPVITPSTTPKLIATPTPTKSPTSITTPIISSTPTSNCDPNYSACVPIASDVDCLGGSGNGPAYVKGPINVIGSDIYGLDSDKDGIACE